MMEYNKIGAMQKEHAKAKSYIVMTAGVGKFAVSVETIAYSYYLFCLLFDDTLRTNDLLFYKCLVPLSLIAMAFAFQEMAKVRDTLFFERSKTHILLVVFSAATMVFDTVYACFDAKMLSDVAKPYNMPTFVGCIVTGIIQVAMKYLIMGLFALMLKEVLRHDLTRIQLTLLEGGYTTMTFDSDCNKYSIGKAAVLDHESEDMRMALQKAYSSLNNSRMESATLMQGYSTARQTNQLNGRTH